MPSESGQDQWVIGVTGGKPGFFLDTGAGHPIDASNTELLELRGWTGICAEPRLDYFQQLRDRRRARSFNVALNDKPGRVKFTMAEIHSMSGIYDNFTDEMKKRNKADSAQTIELEAWTMSKLLEAGHAPHRIDYWSLDTEGSEWLLVSTFPWEKHSVFCLSVEHNWEEPKRRQIQDFMHAKGYDYVMRPEAANEDYYVLHST